MDGLGKEITSLLAGDVRASGEASAVGLAAERGEINGGLLEAGKETRGGCCSVGSGGEGCGVRILAAA